MITKIVRLLKETMNAPSDEQTQVAAKPVARANNSWLRYPLLVVTILFVAVLTLKAKELAGDILAAIEPVAEWFNLPF